MKTTAVIGANFGDEGKGLMTDYFSGPSTVVVRYNGGAQAGHTVVTPEGQRHVFGHFGSGSFAGAATFLSSHFIVNPFVWQRERKALQLLGLDPRIFFSDLAYLTLPYDMLINQQVERERNGNRHGSCGLGINETMTRCIGIEPYDKREKFITSPKDSLSKEKRIAWYKKVRDSYARKRIEELNLKPDKNFFQIFESDVLVENFNNAVEEFNAYNRAVDEREALEVIGAKDVVFEGAQGLLLDEDHRFFPHVTRSKTGMDNILILCKAWHIAKIDVNYATRAYMTRHGRGPFPSEDPALSYEDKTNVHNEWQGTLRFGRLDIDLLKESIAKDIAKAIGIEATPAIAVSCLDQVGSRFDVNFNNEIANVGEDELFAILEDACGVERFFASHGPTRANVRTKLLEKL